ncbi:MAG: protein with repeat domain, partial [Chitinophagaceae bacterium]|nr:protein with repeat domain [Chitinophagaceae bacterium]
KLPGWMVTENLDISPDGRHLAVNHNGNFLSLIELSTGRVVYTLKDREFISVGLDISPDGKLIATGGADNKVNLRDLNTGKLVAAIHTPREEDAVRTGNQGFVLADPQGYYMASKKALDGIVFQYKNSAFNYEQFDLQFNRPDIVLSTLGKADTALVRAYHTAYKKRLKKMGLTEEQVKTEIHKPITRIIDRLNVRPTTSSATYDVSVECYDGRYKLSKLHIVVNNTPLFGAAGKDLSHKDTTTVIEKINIPLSVGRNIISVSCVNENGSESLKQTFEILSNAKPEKKPKVYFVGIAVAKYKDSSMNLGYSVKDVRDLAATFKEIYPDLVIDTLIDKKVTRENILKLKKKLLQTGVNDKIIMAVTGHGLLSDSFDFYYATYDVNFNNPVKRGLKYDELENLLTDVPARQKLLLIDACHSGALDKEEMQNSVVQRNGVKTVNARSTIKIKQKKVSSYNVFDLMQNMFTDLSNNNGTVVISAAGGLEYAFESGKWNNGVFTYCVRKALTESYRMTVSELLTYVSNMVPQLTQGKQRPTSRRESLDHNWNLK